MNERIHEREVCYISVVSLVFTNSMTHTMDLLIWFVVVVVLCSKHVLEYGKVAEELDRMVARMIFESYDMAMCYEPYLKQASYLLRLLKHTGSEEGGQPKQAFVTHTDKSFTTILHQNHVNALEVETRDGQWIQVDFSSPTSFVVIAGDAIKVT